MLVIGLTGGIASGKSTVAEMLKAKGAHLLDADRLAREAVEPGKPAWQEIVNWLGESILLPDRNINREKLAKLVFQDKKMLDRLNKIVHPWVGARFMTLAGEIKKKDPLGVLVYDIPLLIEAGMQKTVDRVILVYVPRHIQLSRLQERDGISPADADRRLQSQISIEDKKKYADVVIDNSGTLEETVRQLDRVWPELIRKR